MSNKNNMDTTTVSAEELEILSHWMEKERQARLKSQQIKPRQTEVNSPLSFAQERLWFLDQLEPGSSAYIIPSAIKLKGKLDIEALRCSLQEIVDRHEILRTAITMQGGQAVQDIKDTFELELKVEDLSAVAESERSAMLKRHFSENALQPFDLTTGRMIRCRLLRLGQDEHILMFAMHHIVTDGWSFAVLFRELGALYAAFCRGLPSPLPELPIQYADFAAWQRQWLHGEVLQAQMDYWTKQLEGVSNLQLPTDHPRPAIQTFSGAYASLLLDKALAEQLKEINRQHNATTFMTLLSAFSILLKRYCGQDDIVVGTPVANRNHREIEDLIGFFVNTLVMRTDVSGNPTFGELLNRVKQIAVDAYQHQDLPFETLVDELQPERDRSRNPVFQVMFAVQNAPSQNLSLEGLTLEDMPVATETVRFDLEMHIRQKGETLRLVVAYNTDLFDADTIERMLGHYQTILAQVAANPACRIEDCELLTETEYQQVVFEWNQTATNYPSDQTVHALFEQQVSQTSDSIAVVYENESLDYEQLNDRANQVAHYLQAAGVGPEDMVGICIERSLEMVVGLLGIMKAGGAYLPLDPEYPQSRIGYMLEDARVKTIVTTSSQRDNLSLFTGNTICLDTDWVAIERESTQNPVSGVTADNLIYAIYTSGSTGHPKGTLIEHRSAVRLVKETNFVEFGCEEVFLQFAPIAFDASTFEIWGSLLNGARLVISPAGRSSLDELGQTIRNQGVTTLWLTAALFNQMLDNHIESLLGVKQLLTGGEALSLPHVKKMLAQLDGRILINGYGPTENTTFTCCHVMTRDIELGHKVPIGRPISNTTVYILDAQMQPVPVGVPGELYTGGDGLARGYLNQPEMTEQKFVANPFSDDPRARLYATGDQVRYRSDGAIEFIGRIDNQVKIRGYRIELGEIEAVLSQHEDIEDCAVLTYEDIQGNKNIAAYFVSDSSLSTLSLRNFLRNMLPQYMIPTVLTKLDELPVTANGKTDYKILASYTEGKTTRDSAFHPPETPAEKKIAGIWETLLNVDRIGAGDNFFDIGGHSLLLIQAKSEIEKEMGVSVPIMDFFHQTLGQIAAYCEKNQPPDISMEEV